MYTKDSKLRRCLIMKAAVWYGQKDVRVEDREPKVLKR